MDAFVILAGSLILNLLVLDGVRMKSGVRCNFVDASMHDVSILNPYTNGTYTA